MLLHGPLMCIVWWPCSTRTINSSGLDINESIQCAAALMHASTYILSNLGWLRHKAAMAAQVVGAFLEGGSPEETKAIQKVADLRPAAPADIDQLGLEFAAKL